MWNSRTLRRAFEKFTHSDFNLPILQSLGINNRISPAGAPLSHGSSVRPFFSALPRSVLCNFGPLHGTAKPAGLSPCVKNRRFSWRAPPVLPERSALQPSRSCAAADRGLPHRRGQSLAFIIHPFCRKCNRSFPRLHPFAPKNSHIFCRNFSGFPPGSAVRRQTDRHRGRLCAGPHSQPYPIIMSDGDSLSPRPPPRRTWDGRRRGPVRPQWSWPPPGTGPGTA